MQATVAYLLRGLDGMACPASCGTCNRFPGGRRLLDLSLCNKVITRNSSGDEIANVNFLYDDIVHVLQNTIDSCINSATDRRGYVLERMCLPNSVK